MTLPALYTLRQEYIELMTKLADMDLDAQTVADTRLGDDKARGGWVVAEFLP